MQKRNKLSKNQLLNTFKAHRRYNNITFGFCVVITVVCMIIGIGYSKSNISNFICSCAVGLSCGYITGWVSSYFADKQTACLIEIDYKISKIDEFIHKCDFETNIFPYNINQFPQRVNIFELEESPIDYFACLCRMGGVFNEIAECGIVELSNITVDLYVDDEKNEIVKIGDFLKRFNSCCMEQRNTYRNVNWLAKQCDTMLSNSMHVQQQLNIIKRDLIKEKESIIFGKRKVNS